MRRNITLEWLQMGFYTTHTLFTPTHKHKCRVKYGASAHTNPGNHSGVQMCHLNLHCDPKLHSSNHPIIPQFFGVCVLVPPTTFSHIGKYHELFITTTWFTCRWMKVIFYNAVECFMLGECMCFLCSIRSTCKNINNTHKTQRFSFADSEDLTCF